MLSLIIHRHSRNLQSDFLIYSARKEGEILKFFLHTRVIIILFVFGGQLSRYYIKFLEREKAREHDDFTMYV